jgi:hypothetical protein
MNEELNKFQLEKKSIEKQIIIGGLISLLSLLVFVGTMNYGPWGLIILIPGVIYMIIGANKFKKLSNRFKDEVLRDIISGFVEDGVFEPSRGLDMNTVYNTEFLKRADRSHTEDYLSGKIDGVEFISSDVKLEERHVEHTKNGTRTYYVAYFLGRIFEFEFNKTFEGYLQVLEGARPKSKRKFNRVKLESVVFNKKFKTYATNDHTAFYVLTPHLMEALLDFEKNNKGKIYFSFIGSKLYLGINNFKDTFELKMFKELNESSFEEFKRELYVIKEVVTELKLNNNIFKKE